MTLAACLAATPCALLGYKFAAQAAAVAPLGICQVRGGPPAPTPRDGGDLLCGAAPSQQRQAWPLWKAVLAGMFLSFKGVVPGPAPFVPI